MPETPRPRVLIAEDDDVSRRVLRTRLEQWDYAVVSACDGADAERRLAEDDAPRLVILDWMMPGKDGLQLCREIRSRAGAPYTYIILLTARADRSDVIQGLDAGADDYVCKPFDAQELKVRLRAGRRIVELQDELIRAREELRQQATHDALTGILNRGAILEAICKEASRAQRERSPFSVVMVDLDHFKRVNDVHGHPAGDEVLASVADTMRASIRPYDSLGRYGGEEFLLLLPGTPASGAVQQAERMRDKVESLEIEAPGGPLQVTASLGVCEWSPEPAHDVSRVLQAADSALYRAKNKGRNRVEAATAEDFVRPAFAVS